jgi:hypothetical protein
MTRKVLNAPGAAEVADSEREYSYLKSRQSVVPVPVRAATDGLA